jgi:predicted enzyme related to lactoylglutathione lyase
VLNSNAFDRYRSARRRLASQGLRRRSTGKAFTASATTCRLRSEIIFFQDSLAATAYVVRVSFLFPRLLDMPASIVNVRYMVDDVEAAVTWYTKQLGFTLISSVAPAFADVALGSLRLLLSGPSSSAGRPMSDGERPKPGGWNRIHLIVDDITSEIARLKEEGVEFRNEMVTGPGGSQVLLIDPSGNLVELFQPARR